MAELSLDLRVTDVDGNLVSDPTVFVRLTRPDGTGAAMKKVSLNGAPVPLRFQQGPAGFAIMLRVTSTRYYDGALFCSVDGDGVVTPAGPVRLPRRSAEWRPSFIAWQGLPGPFQALQTVLDQSPSFRLGRTSDPERFVKDHYDSVDPVDESRVLAKLSLLNLYSRLRTEIVPAATQPWFALVKEMLVATRERFIAEVEEECWTRVRAFALNPPKGFNDSPSDLHRKNFEAIPGVEQVTDLASVKTREDKANLQFTVCRAVRNGKPVFLLDTDIDENGNLLLHAFDLIKHAFSGGTHPIDIHEALRMNFPQVALGYQLEPRESTARVVSSVAAASPVRSLNLGGTGEGV